MPIVPVVHLLLAKAIQFCWIWSNCLCAKQSPLLRQTYSNRLKTYKFLYEKLCNNNKSLPLRWCKRCGSKNWSTSWQHTILRADTMFCVVWTFSSFFLSCLIMLLEGTWLVYEGFNLGNEWEVLCSCSIKIVDTLT